MSRRHLWVEYRSVLGRVIQRSLVFPAPESQLPTLDLLFTQLEQSWLAFQTNTPALIDSPDWQIVRAIAALIPHAPYLPLHLDLLKHQPGLLETLFLRDNSTAGQPPKPGRLLQLHQFEAKGKPPWQPGEEITLADLPFPTSGDRYADAIGLQLYQHGSPDGKIIYEWLDAETRHNAQKVLGELSRNPDERIAAYLKEVYEENLKLTPDLEDW